MDSAVKSSQIAALDIGTAKISVVVADVDDTGEIRVVGIGKVEALGIYDGSIQDVELAVDSIRCCRSRSNERAQDYDRVGGIDRKVSAFREPQRASCAA